MTFSLSKNFCPVYFKSCIILLCCRFQSHSVELYSPHCENFSKPSTQERIRSNPGRKPSTKSSLAWMMPSRNISSLPTGWSNWAKCEQEEEESQLLFFGELLMQFCASQTILKFVQCERGVLKGGTLAR